MPTTRRLTVAAALLAATLLAGCAPDKTVSDTDTASPTTTAPVEDETFPEEGIPDTTQSETRKLRVGQSGTLSDGTQDILRVAVTKAETIRGEEYNKPERGYFLGVYVKVKALADDQENLWGDFYVLMRGHHYDGDAYADRFQPTLDYVTLNTGETSEGWLVFDVPSRHGQVVLEQSYGGGKIATWSF